MNIQTKSQLRNFPRRFCCFLVLNRHQTLTPIFGGVGQSQLPILIGDFCNHQCPKNEARVEQSLFLASLARSLSLIWKISIREWREMGKKLVWEGGESRSDRKVFYCPQLLVCAPGNKGSSVEALCWALLALVNMVNKNQKKQTFRAAQEWAQPWRWGVSTKGLCGLSLTLRNTREDSENHLRIAWIPPEEIPTAGRFFPACYPIKFLTGLRKTLLSPVPASWYP